MSVRLGVPEKQTGDYLARFEERIVDAPQVMSCFQMTGDADYMLRVVVGISPPTRRSSPIP